MTKNSSADHTSLFILKQWRHCRLIFCIGFLGSFLSSCSTVTIVSDAGGAYTRKPDHEESIPFFFWGFLGGGEVDVKDICGQAPLVQAVSQVTFADVVQTLATLGIFRPRTIMLWCEHAPQRRS